MRYCYYFIFIIAIFLLVGCQAEQPTEKPTPTTEKAVNIPLRYATNFTVEKIGKNTLLHIKSPWKDAAEGKQYLLYPKDSPTPKGYPNATKIGVPVSRIICTSTVDIAFLDALGASDKIVAISNGSYVYNPTIRTALAEQKIVEIGGNNTIDYERALTTNPDLAFIYSINAKNDYQKFEELGIPTVFMSDFMEKTPLGRTEWLYFVAHFVGLEQQAALLLDTIQMDYNRIKSMAQMAPERPTVLTGAVYEGTWYVAGGKSLMAQLIADAGGNYLWADNTELSGVPLDFEAVYPKALTANIWINMFSYTKQKDLLASDSRYQEFTAVKNGRVYNYFKRATPEGGSDMFESAIVHPEILLQDLNLIFSKIAPQPTALYYYQEVD